MSDIQTRFNVVLTPEAAAVMAENTTARNKGQWLSDLILRCAYGDETGILERIERRLVKVEKMVAAQSSNVEVG